MRIRILITALLICIIAIGFCSCSFFDDTGELIDAVVDEIDTMLHIHSEPEWIISYDASCTENGLMLGFCTECGISIDSYPIYAKGYHDYGDWSGHISNCKSEHTEYRYCKVCNYEEKKTVPAKLYHTYGAWITVSEATCTQSGKKERICEICGWSETEYFSGHSLDENFVCTLCGKQSIGYIGSDSFYGEEVRIMSAWRVNYLSSEDCFELQFYLKDENKFEIKCSTLVDIKIVNDNQEEIYSKTVLVRSDRDFKYGPASVKIKASEIAGGTISSGDFYFRVYNTLFPFSFGEKCLRVSNLPLKTPTLNIPELPVNVACSSGTLTVNGIICEAKPTSVTLTFSGEIPESDENSDNEIYEIGYKIYDSENYVVASGKLSMSNKLTAGDKFKDESVTIDGLTPGETYTLVLVNE